MRFLKIVIQNVLLYMLRLLIKINVWMNVLKIIILSKKKILAISNAQAIKNMQILIVKNVYLNVQMMNLMMNMNA